jgi:uncharacterized protein (UPF0548 family)
VNRRAAGYIVWLVSVVMTVAWIVESLTVGRRFVSTYLAPIVVAVLARHVGFWSLNGCRIVYAIGTPTGPEFGFAYGTLTDHAESGEEIFQITRSPETGEISYRARAVSRQRAALARLGSPVARALQRRFRRDSARALARAIAG